MNPNLRLTGGAHPFELIGTEAKSRKLKLIPVTSLDRAQPYQEAVTSVVNNNQLGMCIRVSRRDFSRPNFAAELVELVAAHNLNLRETDLVVDLGLVVKNIDYTRIYELTPRIQVLQRCECPDHLSIERGFRA